MSSLSIQQQSTTQNGTVEHDFINALASQNVIINLHQLSTGLVTRLLPNNNKIVELNNYNATTGDPRSLLFSVGPGTELHSRIQVKPGNFTTKTGFAEQQKTAVLALEVTPSGGSPVHLNNRESPFAGKHQVYVSGDHTIDFSQDNIGEFDFHVDRTAGTNIEVGREKQNADGWRQFAVYTSRE
jgi:hypothetical protein